MLQGLTRQEQRTLLLLLIIVVGGIAVHQWRGSRSPSTLVIDAQTGETLFAPAVDVVAGTPAPIATAPAPSPVGVTAQPLIDLNTASVTELTTLSGIGEARSATIIAHREAHGPFARVEDLTDVHGIGDGILARVRDQVTVSGAEPPPVDTAVPTPQAVTQPRQVIAPPQAPPPAAHLPASLLGRVNVNTANLEELMTLPGIGEVLAGRIIEYRTANGPFRRAEDLDDIHRIGPVTVDRLRPLITF